MQPFYSTYPYPNNSSYDAHSVPFTYSYPNAEHKGDQSQQYPCVLSNSGVHAALKEKYNTAVALLENNHTYPSRMLEYMCIIVHYHPLVEHEGISASLYRYYSAAMQQFGAVMATVDQQQIEQNNARLRDLVQWVQENYAYIIQCQKDSDFNFKHISLLLAIDAEDYTLIQYKEFLFQNPSQIQWGQWNQALLTLCNVTTSMVNEYFNPCFTTLLEFIEVAQRVHAYGKPASPTMKNLHDYLHIYLNCIEGAERARENSKALAKQLTQLNSTNSDNKDADLKLQIQNSIDKRDKFVRETEAKGENFKKEIEELICDGHDILQKDFLFQAASQWLQNQMSDIVFFKTLKTQFGDENTAPQVVTTPSLCSTQQITVPKLVRPSLSLNTI